MSEIETNEQSKVDKNINKKLDEKKLTVKEVANLLDESPNVIRNWLKDLKTYIPIQKNNSGYNVFDKEAISVLRQIKHLHRERNYSMRQIEHFLATNGEEYVVVDEKTFDEKFAEEMKELKEQVKQLTEYNKKQDEFNKALINKLEDQSKYLEEHKQYIADILSKREQEFKETLRITQETNEQTAAAKKKGFFAKLFRRD